MCDFFFIYVILYARTVHNVLSVRIFTLDFFLSVFFL